MCWFALIVAAPTAAVVLDYVYPGKLKKVLLKVGWNAIECYTRLEMGATRLYNTYGPSPKPRHASLTIIANGNEVAKYSFSEFKAEREKEKLPAYDFILYDIPVKVKDPLDKYDTYVVRYEKAADVLDLEYTPVKCIELNTVQINVNHTSYTVDFGRKQYMLNGNVLFDRDFVKWYLNSNNIRLESEDKYTVTFFDQTMNYITLPDSCYLYIKNNNYEIVNVL
jgi:hypothetical protein